MHLAFRDVFDAVLGQFTLLDEFLDRRAN